MKGRTRLRAVALFFGAAFGSWASAANAEGFDANGYQPTPIATDGLTVARPTALRHGGLGLVGTFSYAHDPLLERVRMDDGTTATHPLVEHQLYGFFGVAYGLWDLLTLHATLPVALVQSGSEGTGAAVREGPSGTAFGDLRLGARARLVGGLEGERPSRFGLAVDASVFLPTGSRTGFTSDGNVRAQTMLVAEVLPTDVLYAGANAGVMMRPGAHNAAADIGSDLLFAGSFGVRAERDRFRVGVEATSKTRLASSAFEADTSALETLGVASMRFLGGGLVASIGAGPGFSSAPGTPDFRAIARVGWAPSAERAALPVAPPDRDQDGIPDRDDACPDVIGTRHEDPTKNGCPSDRDGDGIVDAEDACPDVPGVAHEDPTKRGCPSDRDGDGIPDTEDACPDVAGVRSEQREQHGCPAVKVTETAIEITEKLHFELGSARIRPDSESTLQSIAKALRDNPEVKRVSIEGHTDEIGSDAFNDALSRARADAVRAWLVANGIEASRLTTRGFGKTRPIADNATEEGREKNRRVEFRITDRAPAP